MSPHDELFDVTPILREAADFFYGNPDYWDLPRKHKIAITACPDACAAPEINCVGLIGALRDGEEGFGVVVGGGLSSVPRVARELGIWVPKDEAVEVLAAILDEWRADLRYRVSRVKARLKFMIDDIGPEGMRERVEARLGRTFDDFRLPPLPAPTNHLGIRRQRDGRSYVGVPVHLGLVSGDQMIALADLAEDAGGDIRITRQQNLVLTNVSDDRLDEVRERLARDRARRSTRARCAATPSPAPASRTATSPSPRRRSRMDGLVQLLEERFGSDADGLRMHLDGCPHACAHHWVGDIGFQGTTVRDEEGKRRGLRHLPARQPRPARRDRAPGVQPCADRGARRRGRRPRRRLGRASARGRELPPVLRPLERRRPGVSQDASRPQAQAGEEARMT